MKLLNDFPRGYLSKPSLRLRKVCIWQPQ